MTDAPNPPSPSPEDDTPREPSPSSDPNVSPEDAPARQSGTPVFGRFAFWICAFPLILYLILMQSSSYLENLRESYLRGDLEHGHHEEGNRPPQEEIPLEEIEKDVDPDARFLFGTLPLGKDSYPYTYTFTIAVTSLFVLLVGWGYFKAPFRIHPLSVVVGVVGIVVWIGLTELDRNFLGLSGFFGEREAFNPFEELKETPRWMYQFLAIRFFGLVCLVPLIEEFFVRGFLIRYVDDPDWDEIPLGEAKTLGWISPTIYGVVAHLTEPLAALAWFSMVTWLYKRTGSIWDCVVAHAVTNLLLGLYVLKFDAWYLW